MRFFKFNIRKKLIENKAKEHVNVKKLFENYKDKKIVWFNVAESLSVFLDRKIDIDVKLQDDEYLFISSSQECDSMKNSEQLLIENLWKNNIDLDKVYVVNSNHLGGTVNVKYIYWEYFETALRLLEHKEIDISKKKHEKKFLCLNRVTRKHRVDFMSAMKNKNLLNYFNASILNFNFDLNEKDNIKLTYDTDDKNTNWWFSIDEKFSYENTIWIVTESVFNDDTDLCFLTEKTFKPILLKMPFIIIGQPYSLKKLKNLGYKTFSHVFDESYDEIIEPDKRMNKIIELVSNLAKQDLRFLDFATKGILEYNYNHLIKSRAEKQVLDTMDGLK